MSLVVSVLSPHCSANGNTVTSVFLALGLGNMRKKVLLAHTDAISDSLYMYLGLHQYEDKTSTPTQMVKLLREGAIPAEDIPDYCKKIYDNTYAFTNNSSNFEDTDMLTFSKYLIEHSDFDYIIYDFNNFDSETANYALKKSDVVVINLTQSFRELDEFKANSQKYAKMFAGKKIILVCNKYNSIISTDKDVAKRIGVKAPVQIIHYNPWIVYGCNHGTLLDICQNIKKNNHKVVELRSDINRLATAVSKIRLQSLKAKQDARRSSLNLSKGDGTK